jgi:hypothetical protein
VIDPAQDGGVRADAEREREQHDGGDAGCFPELAERETEIGEHEVGEEERDRGGIVIRRGGR